MFPGRNLRALVLVLGSLGMSSCLYAQHPPGGGGGQGPGGGMPGGAGGRGPGNGFPGSEGNGGGGADFPGNPGGGPPPNGSDSRPNTSTMRGGLQLGPPGRWWDDKHFAKQLKLSSDQQRRMDSIFEDNRSALLSRYTALQGEEDRMLTLTHAKTLDENALFAQIDRVARARADLEKANTHYLFTIRQQMDGDQIARLEQHR